MCTAHDLLVSIYHPASFAVLATQNCHLSQWHVVLHNPLVILLVYELVDHSLKTASWASSLATGSCTYPLARHRSCVCLQLHGQDFTVQCDLVLTCDT